MSRIFLKKKTCTKRISVFIRWRLSTLPTTESALHHMSHSNTLMADGIRLYYNSKISGLNASQSPSSYLWTRGKSISLNFKRQRSLTAHSKGCTMEACNVNHQLISNIKYISLDFIKILHTLMDVNIQCYQVAGYIKNLWKSSSLHKRYRGKCYKCENIR